MIPIRYLFLLFIITVSTLSIIKADDEKFDCPEIISKNRWGGKGSTGTDYQIIPVKYVVIHHTVTDSCSTKLKCATIVQNIQTYHMDVLNFYDIGYNFLVGNDGRVYEGTGWHIEGAHTYRYNRNGLGIAFIGNFSEKLPTEAALEAAKKLLKCGVEKGELISNYKLLGGRQLISTESPGLELYTEIKEWDNWVNRP